MQDNHFVLELSYRAISCNELFLSVIELRPWAETHVDLYVRICLYHHLEREESARQVSFCLPCHTAGVCPLWLGSVAVPHNYSLHCHWALHLGKEPYPLDYLGHALTHCWLIGTATHSHHSPGPQCSAQQLRWSAVEIPYRSASISSDSSD